MFYTWIANPIHLLSKSYFVGYFRIHMLSNARNFHALAFSCPTEHVLPWCLSVGLREAHQPPKCPLGIGWCRHAEAIVNTNDRKIPRYGLKSIFIKTFRLFPLFPSFRGDFFECLPAKRNQGSKHRIHKIPTFHFIIRRSSNVNQ